MTTDNPERTKGTPMSVTGDPDDPYTTEARLCDDAGMVSDERVSAGSPGTVLDPELTYRRLLNNLRGRTGLPPYTGPAFQCTGSAHLAGEHFRCTNPIHVTLRNFGGDLSENPTITVLCGSTRFSHTFREQNLRLTLAGHIVLSIGCDMRADIEVFGALDEQRIAEIKAGLDELHKRKIDLADEVLILNVGGYIGSSTRSELEYAEKLGKPVRYLEPIAEATR